MDEEELVLKFTWERSLITLGWVGLFSMSCDPHSQRRCRTDTFTYIAVVFDVVRGSAHRIRVPAHAP